MKNKLILLLLLLSLFAVPGCQDKEPVKFSEADKYLALAKTYGYVKYFHPSDEAYGLDWKKFASFAAGKISDVSSREVLLDSLKELFTPIAPTAVFSLEDKAKAYPRELFLPEDTSGYLPVFWQHKGVSYGMDHNQPEGTYESSRVNAKNEYADMYSISGNLLVDIDVSKYKGQKFKFTVTFKSLRDKLLDGMLWVRPERKPGDYITITRSYLPGDLDYTEWQTLSVTGDVTNETNLIPLGFYLFQDAKVIVKEFSLSVKQIGTNWEKLPVPNLKEEISNFMGTTDRSLLRADDIRQFNFYRVPLPDELPEPLPGEESTVDSLIVMEGEPEITRATGRKIFAAEPGRTEIFTDTLPHNILYQAPLTLYNDPERGTYFRDPVDGFIKLKADLQDYEYFEGTLEFNIGSLIICYSLFTHFFPYNDLIKEDWDKAFRTAVNDLLRDPSGRNYPEVISRFIANSNDGHITVTPDRAEIYGPALSWEWIQDQLVITRVYDEQARFKRGDIVTEIDGMGARAYMDTVKQRVSAATPAYAEYKALTAGLLGKKGSFIRITAGGDRLNVQRKMVYDGNYNKTQHKLKPIQVVAPGVLYVDLSRNNTETVVQAVSSSPARAVIFDMRNRPTVRSHFVKHLLTRKDTSKWLHVPQFIYPNQERMAGYQSIGWSYTPAEPYLGNKSVVFITDRRSISYPESLLGYIKTYDLGTIVGETSAGTNGNINPISLPGGMDINYTGLKVTMHDGTVFHGKGIAPDVPVSKTLAGVQEDRDEFLEKAIQVAREGR